MRLPLGVVVDRQGLERLSRERKELQAVGATRRGESGGVNEDVGGNAWELWTALVILCLPVSASVLRLTSALTLDRSAGSLFQVQRRFSGKPSSEVDGAETCDAHRVSSFARRLFKKIKSTQIDKLLIREMITCDENWQS